MPKETKTTLKIRRAPKFLPFLITGAVLGIVFALILYSSASAGPEGASPSQTGILGYLVGWLGVLGAGLGAVAAMILDFIFTRSSKEVEATKLEG